MALQQFRDRAQRAVTGAVRPLVSAAAAAGLSPNHITLAALVVSAVAAVLVLQDQLLLAGLVWLLGGLLDLLDGVLARSQNRATRFGAFLDSTCDRIGEGLVFAALVYHFAALGRPAIAAAAALALLASLLVSYARARVEGLGGVCKVGLMTRAERILLLALGLCVGWLDVVIVVLAATAALTTVQRMQEARRVLGPGDDGAG